MNKRQSACLPIHCLGKSSVSLAATRVTTTKPLSRCASLKPPLAQNPSPEESGNLTHPYCTMHHQQSLSGCQLRPLLRDLMIHMMWDHLLAPSLHQPIVHALMTPYRWHQPIPPLVCPQPSSFCSGQKALWRCIPQLSNLHISLLHWICWWCISCRISIIVKQLSHFVHCLFSAANPPFYAYYSFLSSYCSSCLKNQRFRNVQFPSSSAALQSPFSFHCSNLQRTFLSNNFEGKEQKALDKRKIHGFSHLKIVSKIQSTIWKNLQTSYVLLSCNHTSANSCSDKHNIDLPGPASMDNHLLIHQIHWMTWKDPYDFLKVIHMARHGCSSTKVCKTLIGRGWCRFLWHLWWWSDIRVCLVKANK